MHVKANRAPRKHFCFHLFVSAHFRFNDIGALGTTLIAPARERERETVSGAFVCVCGLKTVCDVPLTQHTCELLLATVERARTRILFFFIVFSTHISTPFE